MEIKAFQDLQVQDKQKMKENMRAVKQNEYAYVNEQAERYENEGRKNR